MTRGYVNQVQFTAGEITPRLYGRTDLEQFYQGCRTLQNWVVLPHGGAARRVGTRFVAPAADNAAAPRLIPFVFGVADSYVLEAGYTGGAGYMRVFRNQSQALETAATITAATQADPVEISTSGSHGWSNGDQIYISGVAGMTELNGRWFTVANVASTTAELAGIDGTGYTAYSSGGEAARVYSIALPYALADLFEVMYAQSQDTMYLAHPDYVPRTLTRTGHTAWTLSNYVVTTGKDPAPAFTSTDNYPAAVTFIQQRLAWAASNDNPQKIWLSKVGDFLDLLAGTNDADGFDAIVASPRVNVGRWLLGSKGLFFGTAGAVWRVNTDAITPSNFPLKRVQSGGCAYRAPLDIDDNVIFARRFGDPANAGQRVEALRFNLQTDDYAADDISIISEHITREGVVDMAWQEQPDRTLWLVLADGTLASCTYYPRQQVVAFARHVLGGSGDGGADGASPRVESVAVIPGTNGDEVWLAVKRTINGESRRYIEVMDPKPQDENLFVDSAVSGSEASAQTAWGGLWHLEGETVAVRADGAPVADHTVENGGITLAVAASTVEIGLGYTSVLTTNDLQMNMPDGASQGRRRHVDRIIFELLDTLGIKATADGGQAGDELEFREVTDLMDTAVPLFSGPIVTKPPSGWDRTGRITVTADGPSPATILAIGTRAEVND